VVVLEKKGGVGSTPIFKTPLEKWVKYGTWEIDSNGWSLDFEKAQLEKASEGIEIDIKDN
jgi:hypothetical protein